MTLPPCVDAEEPKENEHVERHGQRDEREDHPSVRAHPKYTRVVHAVTGLSKKLQSGRVKNPSLMKTSRTRQNAIDGASREDRT